MCVTDRQTDSQSETMTERDTEREKVRRGACKQEGVSRGEGECEVWVMRETPCERALSHALLQVDTRGKVSLAQHDLSAKTRGVMRAVTGT